MLLPNNQKPFVNTRAWRLCVTHYTVRHRVAGYEHGLMSAVLKLTREKKLETRDAFAVLAREIRSLRRSHS